MSKEIELKAYVDDYQATLSLLRGSSDISDEKYTEKFDIYFFNPIVNQAFRVRKELKKQEDTILSKKTIYTVKDKYIDNGIELNTEFEVDLGFDEFNSSIVFFDKLGFKESHRKEKKGYSFIYNKFDTPLHIELLEVNDLGWFFEIEFVVDDEIDEINSGKLVNNLYETLEKFKIPYSNIEKRYYSEMIID
ncbi:MAG: hypothetical protein ACPKOI_06595 [Pleomorphochaeta sp.]